MSVKVAPFPIRPARNQFPVYIPTKSRWGNRLTMDALDAIGVDWFAIIEPGQVDAYVDAGVPRRRVVVLDPAYQRDYDVFDDLALTKSVGPGAARNLAWDHATAAGYTHHWVMDDNLRGFKYLSGPTRLRFADDTGLRMVEDFALRYTSVAMSGPNYDTFVITKDRVCPPVTFNTRIYSCNLILNAAPYRWRGRYNEDTDLSIRMLKDGWATVQHNRVMQLKTRTQQLRGGNSEAFYDAEGTWPKSEMLWRMHPDVTRVVHKFGRVHHTVDYRPFAGNALVPVNPNASGPADTYGVRAVRDATGYPWVIGTVGTDVYEGGSL